MAMALPALPQTTDNIKNLGTVKVTGGTMDNTVIGGTTPAAGAFTTVKLPVAADATLSGTPIIITIYDSATNTPYYFKAYPTKP